MSASTLGYRSVLASLPLRPSREKNGLLLWRSIATGHFTNQKHGLNAIWILDRALYANQHPVWFSLAIEDTVN
jgi:hypothetical protein